MNIQEKVHFRGRYLTYNSGNSKDYNGAKHTTHNYSGKLLTTQESSLTCMTSIE